MASAVRALNACCRSIQGDSHCWTARTLHPRQPAGTGGTAESATSPAVAGGVARTSAASNAVSASLYRWSASRRCRSSLSSSSRLMLESLFHHVQASHHHRNYRTGRILPRRVAALERATRSSAPSGARARRTSGASSTCSIASRSSRRTCSISCRSSVWSTRCGRTSSTTWRRCRSCRRRGISRCSRASSTRRA